MKTIYLYITFIVLAIAIFFFRKSKENPRIQLALCERNNIISNSSEWLNTKQSILKLMDDVRHNPDDDKAKLKLALAYIQESRITNNHSYYDAVALQLIEEVLEKNSNDYQALCAKATIQLSQHHFEDALKTGIAATKINPSASFGYGVLTDANVEIGNYEVAISNADKMAMTRPDMRSYSRISYLREILGDYKGAIEAMNMAVNAGIPGSEQTEWSRIQLGRLYEIYGMPEKAEAEFLASLSFRPGYAYAFAGMGRLSKAKKEYAVAIEYFKSAISNTNDFTFHEELADVYRLTCNTTLATKELDMAISMLSTNTANENSSVHGHYSDKELASLYLKKFRYDLALSHALIEYNRRPLNAGVNQTLAWVRYRRGEYEEANRLIDVALKTNSKDPQLLLQAGLIKIKSGQVERGNILITMSNQIANVNDPLLNHEVKTVSRKNSLLSAIN